MRVLHIDYALWEQVASDNGFTVYEREIATETRSAWAGENDIVYATNVRPANWSDYTTEFPTRTTVVSEDEAIARIVGLGTIGGVFSVQGVSGGQALPVVSSADPVTNVFSTDCTESGGSGDLNVDGSSTPVVFTVDADPTKDLQIAALTMAYSINSIMEFDGESFGSDSGGALTNGVEVSAVVEGGNAITLGLVKLNEDLLRFAYPSAPMLSFTGDADIIVVTVFLGNVHLKAGTADKVQVKVQDDLTTGALDIAYFRATVHGVKE